ncbi:MAG: toll/interleukin-1 receptor domain-containing protein [Chloroflexi bacterium]|nr:toll/interleukin-1 receptor domain-containing protein [Chloroflexota bacterium]MCC6897164.1 toll/interleukin-1 receptor domain-containing protein [Anaerolineae bacterium]
MVDTAAARKRKIFISYRRADNPDFVERIRDWFAWKYGRDSVFMDFDTIPPFTPFADFIREKVRECDLFVAVIGTDWVKTLKERIKHEDDEDYVRTEIRLALELKKPIAPICIKKAAIPNSRDLPTDLRPMLDYNSAHLDSGRHFLDNIEMILNAVEHQLERLDAWKVMAMVQTVQFDVMTAIQHYQDAADHAQWGAALDWLGRIRESGFAPDWYPLDDYEREAHEALREQAAAEKYHFIRSMAERALRRPAERDRVWLALESFWQTYPAYDPDNLAAEFRPVLDLEEEMEDYNTLVLTPIDDHGGFAEDLNRWQPPLDLAVLDDLNTVDESLAEDIFDPDQLAHVPAHLTSETRTITLNEAEQSGILDLEG